MTDKPTTEELAKRMARSDGWVFTRDGDVTCPLCARTALAAPADREG